MPALMHRSQPAATPCDRVRARYAKPARGRPTGALAPTTVVDMGRVFSDLNLNGDSPVRVRPVHGEWGPQVVRTTQQKKRQRIKVVVVFLVVLAVLIGLGYFWFKALMGG